MNSHSPSWKLAELAIALALIPAMLVAQSAHHRKPALKKSPLTSVEAVTDLDAPRDRDDPGTGGGMDAANYFSRKLAARLGNCTDQIQSVGKTWARDRNLVVSKMDRQPGNLLMHIGSPDLNGFFELTYRVKLQQERARVTLFFYSADGAQHEPAGIRQLLSDFHIDTLQDNLSKALLCGGS